MTQEELILMKIANPDGFEDISNPWVFPGNNTSTPMGFFEDVNIPIVPEKTQLHGYEFYNSLRYFGIHKFFYQVALDHRGSDSNDCQTHPWVIYFWCEEDFINVFARMRSEQEVDDYIVSLNGRLQQWPSDNIYFVF